MNVFILDEIEYDNRGGWGEPFRTLEGAKAAAPKVAAWNHYTDEDGEEWCGRASDGGDFVIKCRPLGA